MTLPPPTLIWLNGAFGSGKTTIAKRIVRVGRQALLDPERIGFALLRRGTSSLRTVGFRNCRSGAS